MLDSGVVGETLFVRRPLPRVPLVSDPILLEDSLDLLVLSTFKGEVGLSVNAIPLEGLSVKLKRYSVIYI